MVRKSDVGWLVEPGMREIPRKTLEEAKQLLAQGKDYVRHVIRAWIERKRVRWHEFTFQPERLGIEVYIGRKYDRMWSNKAIEAVFYKIALEDEVDVDVVVNVEAPKQSKDVEVENEDVVEVEDIDVAEEEELEE